MIDIFYEFLLLLLYLIDGTFFYNLAKNFFKLINLYLRFLVALLSSAFIAANAQSFSSQRLLNVADSLRIAQNLRQEKLQFWTSQTGIPIRYNDSDDRGITWILNEGLPFIHATTNDGAAVMTRTKTLLPGGGTNLNLNGSGVPIGLWEAGNNAVLETHEALVGRVDNSTTTMSVGNHGTWVAGTLIGNGVGNADARGMAPAASVDVYSSIDKAAIADFAVNGGLISNHSYEDVVGWWNGTFDPNIPNNSWYWFGDTSIASFSEGPQRYGQYNVLSQEYDLISYNAPYQTIVRAAGNSRGNTGPSSGDFYAWDGSGWIVFDAAVDNPGPDGGADGYDCISPGGISKNIITVGGIQKNSGGVLLPSDVSDYSKSGWGPADDGRIKPDLVGTATSITTTSSAADDAYTTGRSGTSFSTPNIAGSLALIQQRYKQLHQRYMRSATLKGIAIHTAQPTTTDPGPNYRHGWGLLDTEKAIQAINHSDTVLIVEASLSQGDTFSILLKGQSGSPLKATLCWTDPPSNDTADVHNDRTPKLVNDLDLRVFESPTLANTEYYPWKLDVDTPSLPAVQDDNLVDNVEVVEVPAQTSSGIVYELTVTHKGTLKDRKQHFSLIINGRPFDWTGNTDDNWEVATNWSESKIPTSNAWVNIPDGCPHYPVLKNGLYEVGALTVQDGGSCIVQSKLKVKSNVTNQGDLTIDGGQLKWFGEFLGIVTQKQPAYSGGGWINSGISVEGSAGLFGDVSATRLNAFTWNASEAEWDAIAASDSAIPGKGYMLYFGTNGVRNVGSPLQVEGRPIANTPFDIEYGIGDSIDFFGSADGWNFLANPFTCALDFSLLERDNVGNSFSIWNVKNDQYISYSPAGITDPYIAPLQGFWVKLSNASASINEVDIRKHGVLEQTDFHRTKPFDRLVLRVFETSDTSKTDYTVVSLIDGTSKGHDPEWDALKLPNGPSALAFYSINNQQRFAINAIPHNPVRGKTSIPLGMLGGVHNGDYHVTFDKSFMLNSHVVFLEDLKTNTLHDLMEGDVTFTNDTLFYDRFVLHIGISGSLITTENESQSLSDQVWVYEGLLHVRISESANVSVHDAQGRLVWSANHHGGFVSYDLPSMASGVYIVTVETPREVVQKKFPLTR